MGGTRTSCYPPPLYGAQVEYLLRGRVVLSLRELCRICLEFLRLELFRPGWWVCPFGAMRGCAQCGATSALRNSVIKG